MFSTARRSLNVEEFRITAEQGHLMEDKVISSTIGRYQHYFSRYVSCCIIRIYIPRHQVAYLDIRRVIIYISSQLLKTSRVMDPKLSMLSSLKTVQIY